MSSNITSLYVATARLIFESNIGNPASWAYEVANLFPSLHSTLKCCVCWSLLVDPHSPKGLCQHHVCKACVGNEKALPQPCALCSTDEDHVENEELSLLLVCYNKLCSYIRQSETLLKYLSECGGDNDLMNIILEGEAYLSPTPPSTLGPPDSSHSYPVVLYGSPTAGTSSSEPYPSASDPVPGSHSPSPSANHHHHKHRKSNSASHCNGSAGAPESEPQAIYSVLVANEGNKITIKRKVPDEYNMSAVNNRIRPASKSTSSKSSGGCRCGLATAAPGKLTCCGQRCLCYTERRPCLGCKCRGCRNPHTAHGKKKLRGLEEYQMSLNPSTADEFVEEQVDTTIKIVGINSSNNNFQVIRFVDQES